MSCDILLPLSNITQDDFMSALGRDKKEFPYAPCGLAHHLWTHLLKRNWLTSTIMKNERKRLAGKKKTRSLEIHVYLPYDVILEIFMYLYPIDLYHLGQTNKATRNIIMADHGASLWTTVFRNDPTLPACPPDLNESRWTALLFGPDICEECGRHGALVDFVFRQRFCTDCMEQCYIRPEYVSQFLAGEGLTLPQSYLGSLCDLVSLSYRPRGDRYPSRKANDQCLRYLRQDVLAMAKTIQHFQADISTGEPGAEVAYENFKMHRKQHISQLDYHGELCIRWAFRLYTQMHKEWEAKIENISKRIKSRLISCGHDNRDIQSLKINLGSNPRLTRRTWRNVLPGLEDQANGEKIRRLKVERDEVLRERERFIHQIYEEYTKRPSPSWWPFFPPVEQILCTEPFLSLQNCTSNTLLGHTSYTEVMDQLHTTVLRLTDDFTDQLERLLLADRIGKSNSGRTVRSKLDLATSVFTCHGCCDPPRSGMCLIGRDGCLNHFSCYQMFKHGITPSGVGRHTASALILLVDLDPQTTSLKEMDETHALFVCTICPIEKVQHIQGQKVFTWRECVAHAIENEKNEKDCHSIHCWQLLTPDAHRSIRTRKDILVRQSDGQLLSWWCSHCALQRSEFSGSMAIAHAKQIHFIEDPVIGKDMLPFYHHSLEPFYTSSHLPILPHLPEFMCKPCSGLKTRLFAMQELRSHLWDKHDIKDPVIDKDYIKLQ